MPEIIADKSIIVQEIIAGKRPKPYLIIVDDVQEVLQTVRDQLKFLTHLFTIEVSESGDEGMDILQEILEQKRDVGVIISDQIMPGMKGVDFLVKAKTLFPNSITILLTGQAERDDVGTAVNKAALHRFIAKPWDPVEFQKTIEAACLYYLQIRENEYLHENLEQLVKERTQKIEEMVRVVSHDLRSPLTGISSLAELLTDKDIAKDINQVTKFGGIIQKSVSGLLRMANDVLDIGKLESESVQLTLVTKDLSNFLEGLVSTFEPLAISKGISLRTKLTPTLTCSFDESKIGQAINNLLSNAVKFTKKGGTVTLTTATGELNGKPAAKITIEDTGIGIPADKLPFLFDKFSKSHRAGTSGEKGTGLGMSISKAIVELHQGKIEVASTEGKGTTYTVYIPIS
ncbi:MAG: hybrid sensor histidine kinase/response regulator [Bacteroidia bacterium]|nr:hybrid sensor histidine kinase/response regulator [Bacteroidia bacterium]